MPGPPSSAPPRSKTTPTTPLDRRTMTTPDDDRLRNVSTSTGSSVPDHADLKRPPMALDRSPTTQKLAPPMTTAAMVSSSAASEGRRTTVAAEDHGADSAASH